MKNINLVNALSKRFDYENQINDKIYFFTLRNMLKNIIVAFINLILIITRNVTKTFKLTRIKNANTFRTKMKKIKKFFFEKDEKDLINNVVI